jgi:hypothetical protein
VAAADSPHVWLEVLAADSGHYVLRAPLPQDDGETLDLMMALVLPSGPENDAESLRAHRAHPAPLAITSTPEGLVRLWNLETGEITAEVELDGVPVFGRVNETTGRQLAWRDPESESLQVLDFETGENRAVAPLGGQYVQAILLGAEAILFWGWLSATIRSWPPGVWRPAPISPWGNTASVLACRIWCG